MKGKRLACGLVWLGMVAISAAQAPVFTNFIRQVQVNSGVQLDLQVTQTGEQLSGLAINPHGARFELWTVKQSPLTSYLLDTKFVGSYVPQAWVAIRSEDPYAAIPRTRADRPFWVDITVQGLLTEDPTAPVAAKEVKLLRHVQSYGVGGTGVGLDRSQATLLSTGKLTSNGVHTLSYAVTSVPGADRLKLRGEERFSINSLEDHQTPEAQIASQYVQIWPVADAAIAGITDGQEIRFALPTVTLQYNDLYPSSRTYAQVYEGNPRLGATGIVVPGSAVVVNDTVPQQRTVTLIDWDSVIPGDGRWTLEVLTETPFGVERLAYVSFDLDRTIEVNGSVTTME